MQDGESHNPVPQAPCYGRPSRRDPTGRPNTGALPRLIGPRLMPPPTPPGRRRQQSPNVPGQACTKTSRRSPLYPLRRGVPGQFRDAGSHDTREAMPWVLMLSGWLVGRASPQWPGRCAFRRPGCPGPEVRPVSAGLVTDAPRRPNRRSRRDRGRLPDAGIGPSTCCLVPGRGGRRGRVATETAWTNTPPAPSACRAHRLAVEPPARPQTAGRRPPRRIPAIHRTARRRTRVPHHESRWPGQRQGQCACWTTSSDVLQQLAHAQGRHPPCRPACAECSASAHPCAASPADEGPAAPAGQRPDASRSILSRSVRRVHDHDEVGCGGPRAGRSSSTQGANRFRTGRSAPPLWRCTSRVPSSGQARPPRPLASNLTALRPSRASESMRVLRSP
jgi:hypothetical protein